MKKLSTIILLFTLSIADCFATKYYVCDNAPGSHPSCIPGNDSNSGLSPSTPWKTYAKAIATINSANGGDSILFARGGAWDVSLGIIANYTHNKYNPIFIGDYTAPWASGYVKKPIIRNLSGHALWFNDSGGSCKHDEGYVLKNINLVGGGGAFGILLANDVDYLLIDSCTVDSFATGIQASTVFAPMSPGANMRYQNISIKNCTIKNNSGQGYLGAIDTLVIEGCYFKNNGYTSAVLYHNIYLAQAPSNTMTIYSNVIRGNECYQSGVVGGKATSVSLVGHGLYNGILIENNYIHEDTSSGAGAWGIGIGPGYPSTTECMKQVIIRGNKVVNTGGTGITIGSCPRAIIENNVVITHKPNYSMAIVVGANSVESVDSINTKIIVRNNSILLENIFNDCYGIWFRTEGVDHICVNNIISINGQSVAAAASSFFYLTLPVSSFSVVSNNLGYSLGNVKWRNGGTLAAWQATTTLDANSILGNPLFASTSMTATNLALSSSLSPAVNAGHSTLSTVKDINNVTRTLPDIGAYEFVSVTTDISSKVSSNLTEMHLYPIPANNYIKIEIDNFSEGSKVQLINLSGSVVLEDFIAFNNNEINTSLIASGLYVLRVINKSKTSESKIVIQH